MPSLDSITFDTMEWRLEQERETVRVWRSPVGDSLQLVHILKPPGIPADLRSINDVRRFFRDAMAALGNAILAVDTLSVGLCTAIRLVVKVPQQPHGMTYLGGITLPFRDFSFVLRVECVEAGMTGVRDSTVLDEALGDGRVTIDSESESLMGWMCDPYDSNLSTGFHRNLSEAVIYDERFPHHPLSRVRRLMNSIERSLTIAEDVQSAPPYVWHGPHHSAD